MSAAGEGISGWTPRQKLLAASGIFAVLATVTVGHGASAAWVARALLGLAGVGGLVVWTRSRVPRTARGALPLRLSVTQRVSLSPKTSLALVEAEGCGYLIVFGDGFAELKAIPPSQASLP